jgi:hypothetical protein
MKHLCALAGLLTILALSSCASLVSRSISHMEKGTWHRVIASSEGYGYLMLTLPTLDSASRLRAQCMGDVTGVVTTVRMRNWFLIQHFEETAEAWCQ